MSINNVKNIGPDLAVTENRVNQNSDNNHASTQQLITNESTLIKQDVALALGQLLTKIAGLLVEVNENEAILNGLSSVGGQIDGTATAVNTHTTERAQAILDAISNIDLSSVITEIRNIDLSALSTTQRVNAIEQALISEIRGIDLSALSTTARVNAIEQTLIDEIRDIDVSALATTAQVNAANDETNALINSRAENSLADWIRDIITSAQTSINGNIDAESANIVNEIRQKETGCWTPKVEHSGNISTALFKSYAVNGGSFETILSVNGSGMVTQLRVPRMADIQVVVDGVLSINLNGDGNSGSVIDLIRQNSASAYADLTYNTSLRISVRRGQGFTAVGSVILSRSRITGA